MEAWERTQERLANAIKYYPDKLGWKILPVHGIDETGKCTCGKIHRDAKERAKHPASLNGQKDATNDPSKIATWWQENPNYNIGVMAAESGIVVIDIDPRSDGDDSFEDLKKLVGEDLPPTVEAITGRYYNNVLNENVRGRHIIYKCDPSEKLVGNLKSHGLSGIDIKHNGYILIAPSRHSSGVTYEWKPGHAPWEIEIAEAPESLLKLIRGRGSRSANMLSSTSFGAYDWNETLGDLTYDGEKLDIDQMMRDGLEEGERAVKIYQIACALANRIGVETEVQRNSVETMMIRFNQEAVKPPLELEGTNSVLMHTRRAIKFVMENPKSNLYWDGISDWVKDSGMAWAEKATQEISSNAQRIETTETIQPETLSSIKDGLPTANAAGEQLASFAAGGTGIKEAVIGGQLNLPKDVDAVSEEAGGRPGYRSLSDIGNGRRLVDLLGSGIRHTPGVGWFIWRGNYWEPDIQKISIRELSKSVPTSIASEIALHRGDETRSTELLKWANQSKSNARMLAMIDQATSDSRIQVPIDDWDNNPQLLGVKNGVVDLKTGELKKGRPDLHITRRSPIDYVPGLKDLRWDTFLDEATKGDKELQNWLQRAVGYTLTGLNNQDIMFLIYGPPGSGKNTFIESIYEALGKSQYAWALDTNVLALGDKMSTTDEYHMAELRGRRMIWVDELPENERIKENQVKKLTGSGTIQGRSPGERPIQFTSQGKLWISTNHRPIITDDAMWRRIRPIPLTNKPEKPDPSLKKYLADPEGGLPAVLSWAVEGAIKYLSSSSIDPLGWCSAVKEAHTIYQQDEDRIGAFLDEETTKQDGGSVPVVDLYQIYKMWSSVRSEKALTQIAFQRKLKDRGIEIIGIGSKATIKGYAMKPVSVATQTSVDFSRFRKYSDTTQVNY